MRVILALLLIAGCVQAQSLRHVMRRAGVVANASQIPRDGLVAEYLFASNANDTSGYGNNATISGNATVTNGIINLSGGYMYVPQTADTTFGTNDSFTVSMWFDIQDTTTSAYFWQQGQSSAVNELRFYKSSDRYYVGIRGTTSDNRMVLYADCAETGWTHLVLIYNSGTSENSVDLFVNNASKSISTLANNLTAFNKYTGTMNFFAGYDGYSPQQGSADTVRIYNRATSTNEIQQLYNEGHD